jgi:hypothetical protein
VEQVDALYPNRSQLIERVLKEELARVNHNDAANEDWRLRCLALKVEMQDLKDKFSNLLDSYVWLAGAPVGGIDEQDLKEVIAKANAALGRKEPPHE